MKLPSSTPTWIRRPLRNVYHRTRRAASAIRKRFTRPEAATQHVPERPPESCVAQLVEVNVGGTSFRCAVNQLADDSYTKWIRGGASTEAPVAWALKLLTPNSQVLDLGANVGTFAFAIAQRCRRVIAVEALPDNAALLTVGAAANRPLPVVPVHAAMWDSSGVVSMGGHSAWAQVTGSATPVPALIVSDLVAVYADGPIDLVKIDVEGAEEQVLPQLIALSHGYERLAIIYEANQSLTNTDVRTMHRSMVDAGFQLWYLDPVTQEALPVDLSVPQYTLNCDILALKGEWDQAPVASAWSDDRISERLASDIATHDIEVHRLYARAVAEQFRPAVSRHPDVVAALLETPIGPREEAFVERYRAAIR